MPGPKRSLRSKVRHEGHGMTRPSLNPERGGRHVVWIQVPSSLFGVPTQKRFDDMTNGTKAERQRLIEKTNKEIEKTSTEAPKKETRRLCRV